MALSAVTPRDRLQRLVDLGRKTLRYWYLIAIFAVVGGGLSFAFAITRPNVYQSWAVLFYQERIQSSLLQNREEVVQRNIGDRYRELLLARAMLEKIIHDPKLDPFPDLHDDELAIDRLRQAIRFESRGANAFRITYSDEDPDRCEAITAALTEMLRDKDEALRNEQAQATVDFARKQKGESGSELATRERALVDFLYKHPEFVADPNQPQGEGKGILKDAAKTKPGAPSSGRLQTLQREAYRLNARLNAAPGEQPVVRVPAQRTPEQVAADAAVADAQREVAEAQRDIAAAQAKGFTERHPTMIAAQTKLDGAKAKLAAAKASVPPDVEQLVVPATAEDRAKLQQQLNSIESQIADEERRLAGGTPKPVTSDDQTNAIVQLETEHDKLQHDVDEQRKTDAKLSEALYSATLDAATKRAEQDRLSVVDPAFKPVRPNGPGKTIFLMAGMVLFVGLGLSLAVGLAVIDDRLYRRDDIDQLGVAVLAVIPHAQVVKRRA
jgi:uncharacterized protein involved in exopolysaccharide biosynthesis